MGAGLSGIIFDDLEWS